jgi:hypothetical protein
MICVVVGALIVALVWFLAAGPWYLALASYVVVGGVWVARDMRRPPLYRPMGYMSARGTVLLLVIWPLRAATDFLETRKLRRSPERYVVVGEGDHKRYGLWDDAVRVAREEAKSTGERIMILDTATFAKQFGLVQHKSWFVQPNGKAERLPRSFL